MGKKNLNMGLVHLYVTFWINNEIMLKNLSKKKSISFVRKIPWPLMKVGSMPSIHNYVYTVCTVTCSNLLLDSSEEESNLNYTV